MEKQGFSRNFGHHFGQKLGKKLGKNIGRKGEALGQKLDQRVEKIAEQAFTVAQTAKETAKVGLDQILLNLEHRGVNIKDKQDIIQRMGQTVLDRAEKIRSQIAEHPSLEKFAPSWMKESTKKTETATTSDATATEASATAPAHAEEMTETVQDVEAQIESEEADHGDLFTAGEKAKRTPKTSKTAKTSKSKTTRKN